MKNLFIILFSLLSFNTIGQSIQLNWKIGEKDTLHYLTVMKDIDTSDVDINFEEFFKSFSDSSAKGITETKKILNELNKAIQNIDFITTLTNKGNGIVDIVMTTKEKEKEKENSEEKEDSKEKQMTKMLQSMTKGIMLRGSVFANGGIHSFWVKSTQKNLIAMLFELPTKPIKVGDKWEIDVSLIANDQNFSCDSSYKINEVSLLDIKKENGETIAIIKYDIIEYVNGTFAMPSFMGNGEAKKTMMKITLQAIAEFSIEKGRWKTYDGIMGIESTGIMTSSKKTKFTLISQ